MDPFSLKTDMLQHFYPKRNVYTGHHVTKTDKKHLS